MAKQACGAETQNRCCQIGTLSRRPLFLCMCRVVVFFFFKDKTGRKVQGCLLRVGRNMSTAYRGESFMRSYCERAVRVVEHSLTHLWHPLQNDDSEQEADTFRSIL